MRVVIEAASLSLSSGGLARYTSELSLALGRCYPEDEFFLVSDQPFRMPSPAPVNLKCGGGPRNAMERRWWLWGLAREMGRRGADLVHEMDGHGIARESIHDQDVEQLAGFGGLAIQNQAGIDAFS